MLDTKGPEVRLGYFKDGKAELEKGQDFTLTIRDIQGDSTQCSITYKELPDEAVIGSRILIADGVIELKVLDKNETDVICRVVNGGTIGDRKNVNIPGATSKLPAITEKDIADLIFGIENEVDFIAASFIRKAADVLEIRKILEENGGRHIQIIAKIENQEGVDNVRDILKVCDGLMVARGDLGVEIPTEEIPLTQKLLIKRANEAGKPVITATQMLDSMMRNPRPTRAEVTDVANSIIDGTDAIMLSGETAAGKYPVESVLTMSTIAERIEKELDYGKRLSSFSDRKITIADAISHSSCTTAFELQATAIITPTQSGSTARMVSRFRPKAPIIATTSDIGVMRKLCLSFGVYPIYVPFSERTDDIIDRAVDAAVEAKLIKNGLAVYGPNMGTLMEIEAIAVRTSRGTGRLLVTGIVEEEEIGSKDGRTIRRRSMAKASTDNVITAIRKYLCIDPGEYDIHLNFPGGIPVDGPSAGIAIATAIYSAITNSYVDNKIAMTGEISIRGKIKGVGGIIPKIEAAVHAGVKRVIIPKENWQEIFNTYDIEVIPVESIVEAVNIATMRQAEVKHLKAQSAEGNLLTVSAISKTPTIQI
jgi:pyruvate kinase